MSAQNHHPLPAAPGQQGSTQHGRPRAKSGFSFHSRKSSGSSHSPKLDLHETHEEKLAQRLQSKADPGVALMEAEPSAVALQKTSIAPIRAIQHLDHQGNPIADPDRSNPTRSRWERPLDTIRAFEAAIDGNYSRKSYIRTESDAQSTYNRRSSYFGGTQVTTDERPRGPHGYYSGRPQSYRPESFADGRVNGMKRPDSYYQTTENSGPANGYYPNRSRYPRTASEPHFNHGQGIYPSPGNQPSYETVATASGSGSSDPEGYQTENSSVDRVAPLPFKEPGESYGFNGFGGNPHYLPPGHGLAEQQNGQQRQGNGYSDQEPQGAPPVPRKQSVGARVPIKLNKSNGNAGPPPVNNPQRPTPTAEKRKSWLGRRFSKS